MKGALNQIYSETDGGPSLQMAITIVAIPSQNV